MEATLLPSRLVGSKPDAFLPEKRLALAVLGVAIADYQKYAALKDDLWSRRRFAEARRWLMSDGTRWPFSFLNICEALDLDASVVREGIRTCQRRSEPRPMGLCGRGQLLRE
jgi:hypothetical protein